jgi:hypothetical protein
LEANNLIGTIPDAIGALTSLTELHLGYNEQLTGTLPSSVGKLTKLSFLSIPFCGITGTAPASLHNLKSLNYIDFRYNSDFYYPMDIKSTTHEIGPMAKSWNNIHSVGILTELTGWDPYCLDGTNCRGSDIAIGTYWSQSQLSLQFNSWTTRGRYGTINSGCDGKWCNELKPGEESSPIARPSQPKRDTVNTVEPDIANMVPVSMG